MAARPQADVFDERLLARELARSVRGEVRFSAGSRALYSTDASNYRQLPIGVVVPRDADDVVAALAICRGHGAPVLARGAGTSLAGQTCNEAVVLDFSKYMNRIVEIDRTRRLARVQPGLILDHLCRETEAGSAPLTFGPDPATHDHCTLGGMIGNNSCGAHSVMSAFYGPGPRTSDNVVSLDILTYDGLRFEVGPTSTDELEHLSSVGGRRGEIYSGLRALRDRYGDLVRARYPDIPRRVSGYNLDELLPERGFNLARALVGSESTCAIVLEATVHLMPSPPKRALLVVGYHDVAEAGDHVETVHAHRPIACEGFDDVLAENNRKIGVNAHGLELLPDAGGWLLAEFGADSEAEAVERAEALLEDLRRDGRGPLAAKLFPNREAAEPIWQLRESGLGAAAFVPGEPDHWTGWEDAAVPPARIGDYLRDFRALLDRYDYRGATYGHLGQGCVHTRISFDLVSAEGIRTWRAFLEDAADLVVSYGGALSGEHGDGQARAELLPRMFGEELVQAFREFKTVWDPAWKLNPGKVVDPYRVDENLRLGADYRPPQLNTHFAYATDGGSFAHAALRCVGVGKCRHTEGGTMCPSFMVTREEQHSTRGRARLLFEMLNGELDGWRSTEVREALDLCLACKGCKHDCPVSVDMASYKAEFLSHHYAGRLRPRSAYALGLIYWWARAAGQAPRLANALTQTPGAARVLKRLAGVAPERELPRFAPQTFRDWFHARRPASEGAEVVLWPDTFTNHFHPEVGRAAVEVLEAAGFRPTLPARPLCCGRPLYDWGMLDLAKRLLNQTLRTLRQQIRNGVPLVALEPSCLTVFRDELIALFPKNDDACRLAEQSFTLAELLQRSDSYQPAALSGAVLLHGHCHQKAVISLDAEQALLHRAGLELELPDTGCCGMAGAFGFERGDHYAVSIAAGERVLLPAVRNANAQTLILADGFSCREQIRQQTDRHALHLAQLLQQARPADATGRA